jgi:hypothetical protein
MEQVRNAYRIFTIGQIPEVKKQVEDLSVDGRIILKSILNKKVLRAWFGITWLRIG